MTIINLTKINIIKENIASWEEFEDGTCEILMVGGNSIYLEEIDTTNFLLNIYS